jgi:orotidine-5'-phosphate decarboxylase
MVAAAAEALPRTKVVGVTILSSRSAADLERLGVAGPPEQAVLRLARLAVDAGARALVCSPQEVAAVRREVGPDITVITPGVRPVDAANDDQARVATPQRAIADGADLVVIGRPITGSDDPAAAAEAIVGSLTR